MDHPYQMMYDNNDSYKYRRLFNIHNSYDDAHKNIRIKPYFDYLDSSNINSETKLYIKQLISASIKYFEKFIKVIPVDGPLYLAEQIKSQYWQETNPFGNIHRNANKYHFNQYKCGYDSSQIPYPKEFYRPNWYFDSPS